MGDATTPGTTPDVKYDECGNRVGHVTRDMFLQQIQTPQVVELLDELEIHVGDRMELFDVIDADSSGSIDISELILGLLKLRSGGADKTDVVSAILGIRSIA